MRKVRRHGNTNAYPFLMHSWTLDLWYIFAICRWYVKEIFGKVTGALVGRVQGMGIFASIFWYGHPGCQFLLIPLSGTVTIIFRQVICYLLYFTCPSFQDGHHTHTINFTQLYPHCKPLRMAITHRPTLAVLVGCIHPHFTCSTSSKHTTKVFISTDKNMFPNNGLVAQITDPT